MIMVCQGTLESFFVEPDQHQVRRAKEELGEDDGRMARNVELLIDWFRYQEHLPQDCDRNMLKNYLRGNKHELERTKRKLEFFYYNKTIFPEFYSNRDPDAKEFSRMLELIKITCLPKLTETGDRVSVISVVDPDPTDMDMEVIIKYILMAYDLLLTSKFPVANDIVIYNLTNATPNHVVKLIGTSLKKVITILRTACPLRMKAFHLVNAPSWIGTAVNAVRPLIHPKLRDRFVVHKGVDSLAEYLPPEILPSDLGGHLESIDTLTDKMRDLLRNNAQWFKEQEQIKSTMITPSRKMETFQIHLGLEGSFRQLNID